MIIIRKSPMTGKTNEMNIDVTCDQLEAWNKGELIQKAMPNLTADEREFIKTGFTPDDWARMFGK